MSVPGTNRAGCVVALRRSPFVQFHRRPINLVAFFFFCTFFNVVLENRYFRPVVNLDIPTFGSQNNVISRVATEEQGDQVHVANQQSVFDDTWQSKRAIMVYEILLIPANGVSGLTYMLI
jgi:hypothetical protein